MRLNKFHFLAIIVILWLKIIQKIWKPYIGNYVINVNKHDKKEFLKFSLMVYITWHVAPHCGFSDVKIPDYYNLYKYENKAISKHLNGKYLKQRLSILKVRKTLTGTMLSTLYKIGNAMKDLKI